jgi:hypothetical protein
MTPDLKNKESSIRMDLLYRLRWNLRADLQHVEITVGASNEEKLVSLFDHSSADESLAVPGLSSLEVASAECLDKYENSYDEGSPDPDGYRPPPLLFIENEDGKSITLRQFVTEVHAYMNENIAEIKKALRGQYTSSVDEMIFFRRVWAVGTSDDNIRLSISLVPGMERTKMEDFWSAHLHQARMHANQRGRQ